MSLHHGPTDLCGNYFTVSFILLWFQASSQASLRFCLRALLLKKCLEGFYMQNFDRLLGTTCKVKVLISSRAKRSLQLCSSSSQRVRMRSNDADEIKASGSADVPAHKCCLGMLYYSQSIHGKGWNPVLCAISLRSGTASCLYFGTVE